MGDMFTLFKVGSTQHYAALMLCGQQLAVFCLWFAALDQQLHSSTVLRAANTMLASPAVKQLRPWLHFQSQTMSQQS
jgi:hypothetical protein